MNIKQLIRSWADRVGLAYADLLNRREYRFQGFVAMNERPVEYRFVFEHLTRACPRTVLDVGTGATALPHLMRSCGFVVTAIDNIRDYWPSGMVNRHYHVINDDITRTDLKTTFDFITCVSVLEHIREHQAAMRSMLSLLNPGGLLVVTFPYNESQYHPNVYDHPESGVRERQGFITQAYSRNEINSWLTNGDGELVEQEYWRFFTGEVWTCGERICPPIRTDVTGPHQISCLLIRKKK